MKHGLVCLLALHLALVPCFADVIPSRRSDRNAAAEQTVKARLQQVGMNAADAERHVGDLSAQETAYFAQSPERVQVAGALYWYEWVAGAAVLTAVVAFWILFPVRLR